MGEELKELDQKQESNLVNAMECMESEGVDGRELSKNITEKSKRWWSEELEEEICSRKRVYRN